MSRNDPSDEKVDLKEICEVLCRIEDSEQMRQFLEELLTPSERHDLALRWELMNRLKQGIPQRKIAKDLSISLCKITRGAKILKQDHSISKHYLNTGEKDESKNPS
ncbi:MAG: Trp family transcriptional regulator [Planctomycetota bacterium]|jgi:TrpR family trp operon transcriptional repressor